MNSRELGGSPTPRGHPSKGGSKAQRIDRHFGIHVCFCSSVPVTEARWLSEDIDVSL